MHTLWQDLRYALRMLGKNPGFTAIAVFTLALGISVNSTMFTMVSTYLMRRLPAHDPDRVLVVSSVSPTAVFQADTFPLSPPEFLAWRDANQLGMTSDRTEELYLAFSQSPEPLLYFAIRTMNDSRDLAKSVERAIWAVDRDQAVGFVIDMNQLFSESLAPQRMIMLILSAFGAMTLLMAAIGIYGLIANSVARRTQGFGIRLALGARPADVVTLVVKQGIALVLLGVSIGILGALALMHFLASLLYGVRPLDPLTLTLVAFAMIGVALLAGYIPARRATRIESMEALRYE
jgi:putative ABC transport system permease protein